MYTRFLNYTLIITSVLLAVDLIGYATPFNSVSVLLLCCLLFIAFARLFVSIEGKRAVFVKVLALCLAVPIVLFGLALLVLAVINMPPAAPFDSTILLKHADAKAVAAYHKVRDLLADRNGCFSLSENSDEMKILPGKECWAARDELLDFISSTPVAVPLVEEEGILYLPWGYAAPDWSNLERAFVLELRDIDGMFADGHKQQAEKAYLRLWQLATVLLASENDLLGCQFAIRLTDLLAGYYRKGKERIVDIQNNLDFLINETVGLIDTSFAKAFGYEYAYYQTILFVTDRDRLSLDRWSPSAVFKTYLHHWPFFDKFDYLKSEHDFLSNLAKLSQNDTTGSDRRLGALSDRLHAERKGQLTLRNLYGSYLLNRAMPDFTNIIRKKNRTKEAILKCKTE